MASFIDVSCPKCGRKHGWFGSLYERPPCPKCGHQVPYNEEDELALKEIEELLTAKVLYDREPIFHENKYMWGCGENQKLLLRHFLPKGLFDKLKAGDLVSESEGLITRRLYQNKAEAIADLEQAFESIFKKKLNKRPLLSQLMNKGKDVKS